MKRLWRQVVCELFQWHWCRVERGYHTTKGKFFGGVWPFPVSIPYTFRVCNLCGREFKPRFPQDPFPVDEYLTQPRGGQ